MIAISNNSRCNFTTIYPVQKVKYQDMTIESIDVNLKRQNHIMNTTRKIILLFYKIKTLINTLSATTLGMVFIAMAQSIYSYGIGSWSGAYNIHLDSLEITINSFIKISFKKHYRTSTFLLYTDCNSLNLTQSYT